MEKILLYFALKYRGDFDLIYRALERKEKVDENEFLDLQKELHCQYTTIVSTDYPQMLKYINCPPFVLFYYGDLSIANNKTIGVIGKRIPSEYGIKITKTMVKDLTYYDYTVVSGLARGIDGVAHRTVVENSGHTIAVLGSGIDYVYPEVNRDIYEEMKKDQLIVSEYPGNTEPTKRYFPKRNRIIAGLSESLLVCEANEKSGTMITVGFALEQGKDVFAIPSPIDSPMQGCNTLIQSGAKLVKSIQDIVDESY